MQTHWFEYYGCRYSAEIDMQQWKVMQSYRSSYTPATTTGKPELYLQFSESHEASDRSDLKLCSIDSQWQETTSFGAPIQYELLRCPPMEATPFSAPPGQYRLLGLIVGKRMKIGASLYTERPQLLTEYRARHSALMHAIAPKDCKFEFGQ